MNREPLVQLPEALTAPTPISQARYVMAIDGGATKTLAAVLDLDDRTVHLAEGGPSNADAVGAASAVDALLAVADRALARAGIAQDRLAAAVLAVAGTDTEAIAHSVRAARTDEWIVVNDVVGAWATATGGQPGVGAISGTGSNVFGVGPGDRPWRVGGWGHLLGDEGSGYWLGNESIRAALADRDGSGPQTALAGAVVEFFDVDSVEALAAHVYAKPLTKGEIAAFAVQACKLAQGGDAVAHELYTRGAKALAAQITSVIGHTGLGAGGDEFPVGLIGSVFQAGPIFVDPIVAAVRAVTTGARVAVIEMAPVGGGLQLAARACGHADAIAADELEQLLDVALS